MSAIDQALVSAVPRRCCLSIDAVEWGVGCWPPLWSPADAAPGPGGLLMAAQSFFPAPQMWVAGTCRLHPCEWQPLGARSRGGGWVILQL